MARTISLAVWLTALLLGSALCVTTVHAGSIDLLRQAASRAQIPDSLLLAIAWVESRGVLTAVNIEGESFFPVTWNQGQDLIQLNQDRNLDVGVMQVNVPTWSARLNLPPHVLYQPHVNLPVAAYVLRQCIDASGGDLWKGVACYHSQHLPRQKRYVQAVWNAYNLLRRRGVFGPALACADAQDVGAAGTCQVPWRQGTAQPAPRPVGRYTVPIQPPAAWRTVRAVLPLCPGDQPRVQTVRGSDHLSFVFFAPGQAWPDVEADGGSLTIGMCVGCQPSDLVTLSHDLAMPVDRASPGLLRDFNVSCVPTVVRMIRSRAS